MTNFTNPVLQELQNNKVSLNKKQLEIFHMFCEMGCRTGKTTLVKLLTVADKINDHKTREKYLNEVDNKLVYNKTFCRDVQKIAKMMR